MQPPPLKIQATERLEHCARQLLDMAPLVGRLHQRYGPIFKESIAALENKLQSFRPQLLALDEVSQTRTQILWRQFRPILESLEDGIRDFRRLAQAVSELPLPEPEQMDMAYEEIARRERWFLHRLRHNLGELVAEGNYRCCACGAYSRPGAGQLLGACLLCGGVCHHNTSVE